jgi:hypothetical protein
MSIDGIGRPPGGPGGVGPLPGPASPSASGEGFQVERGSAPSAAAVPSSGPLARLARGEIDVEQYLDARVEEAIAPLASKVPLESLEYIRTSLRAELENDPVLVELVRRATSATSPAATET